MNWIPAVLVRGQAKRYEGLFTKILNWREEEEEGRRGAI
jgi:hypothetical protein